MESTASVDQYAFSPASVCVVRRVWSAAARATAVRDASSQWILRESGDSAAALADGAGACQLPLSLSHTSSLVCSASHRSSTSAEAAARLTDLFSHERAAAACSPLAHSAHIASCGNVRPQCGCCVLRGGCCCAISSAPSLPLPLPRAQWDGRLCLRV